jgi:hypothetical protein
VKKSAAVRLTIVAMVGIATHAKGRPDPCGTATFDQQACSAAIQNQGYCWNDRWVRLKYHYPFPYYYDAYQDFLANGGVVASAPFGTCGPSAVSHSHGVLVHRAGFGTAGACHAAHS